MGKLARRHLIGQAAALTALPWAATAQTSGFPARPIRMLVGFAPGGGTTIVSRLVAQKLR